MKQRLVLLHSPSRQTSPTSWVQTVEGYSRCNGHGRHILFLAQISLCSPYSCRVLIIYHPESARCGDGVQVVLVDLLSIGLEGKV